uniref:Uncharacterized protein n=1 Tax=Romanomermis culicivorax TaxID=13658 RepID=A0A915L4M0_ROMCU
MTKKYRTKFCSPINRNNPLLIDKNCSNDRVAIFHSTIKLLPISRNDYDRLRKYSKNIGGGGVVVAAVTSENSTKSTWKTVKILLYLLKKIQNLDIFNPKILENYAEN